MATMKMPCAVGSGGVTLEPLAYVVRGGDTARYVQNFISQKLIKNYKYVRTMTSAEASATYSLPVSGSYINTTSVSYGYNNNVSGGTLSTTPVDISALSLDDDKEMYFTVTAGSVGFYAFGILFYND